MADKSKLPDWIASHHQTDQDWQVELSDFDDQPTKTQPQPQLPGRIQLGNPIHQDHSPSQDQLHKATLTLRKEGAQLKEEMGSREKLNSSSRSLSQFLRSRREGSREGLTYPGLFSYPEEKTIVVMDHIVQLGQNKERSIWMSEAIRDIEDEKLTIRQAVNKMNNKDLDILVDHRMMLTCLEETLILLIRKFPNFAPLTNCNFFEIIDIGYQTFSCKIDFQQFKQGIIDAFHKLYPNQFPPNLIEEFTRKLIVHTEGSYQRQKAEKKRLRNKKIRQMQVHSGKKRGRAYHRIEGVEEEDDHRNFDGQSIYGLFQNRDQELQHSKQGVLNYRIHRAIELMKVCGTLDPFKNLQKAKDYALFLVRLTNLHIQALLKESMVYCKLTLQNKVVPRYCGVCDQFSYFKPENFSAKISQPLVFAHQKVKRLIYPSFLTQYNELRYKQMTVENKLYLEMYPQLFLSLSRTQFRSQKLEKRVNEFYEDSEVGEEVIQEHKVYREPGNPEINKIKIESEHIAQVLEGHAAYRDSQLLMRLRTLY